MHLSTVEFLFLLLAICFLYFYQKQWLIWFVMLHLNPTVCYMLIWRYIDHNIWIKNKKNLLGVHFGTLGGAGGEEEECLRSGRGLASVKQHRWHTVNMICRSGRIFITGIWQKLLCPWMFTEWIRAETSTHSRKHPTGINSRSGEYGINLWTGTIAGRILKNLACIQKRGGFSRLCITY